MAEAAGESEAIASLAVPDEACRIACDALAQLGIAQARAGLSPFRAISLTNIGEIDLPDIVLSLVADPAILRAEPLRVGQLAAGASRTCPTPSVHLVVASPGDAAPCTLSLAAVAAGRVVGRASVSLVLLPATHWAGTETAAEALAAFVGPGDPAVDDLLAAATDHLARAGRADGPARYTDGRARVWETAQAIHAALRDQGLTHRPAPPRFDRFEARIRGAGAILADGNASDLERALVLAAAFERAGLNPLVVLSGSTVSAGLWLVDARLPEAAGDDAQDLRKRRDLEEVILIALEPDLAFPDAIARGARMVEADRSLDLLLDVRGARLRGVSPLASEAPPAPALMRPPALTIPFAPAPAFPEDRPPPLPEPRPEPRPRDRLEAWKLRLLDLTLRNKLLNFRSGKASVTLVAPDPDALAARLTGGASIRLLPKPTEAPADEATLRDTLANEDILTLAPEDDLDARLTDLFRTARTGLEEGGANVLHLAFGFLAWTRGGAMAPVRAPLLLVPVALTRTSVGAGFRLVRHDGEARFNPTLIEMLARDFGLALPDLDAGLHEDGLDVTGLWRTIRGHVRDLKGFEVETGIVLSTFAFTKVLMWRDLSERTDLLKRNPVVRHLLDTPTLAYGDASGFPAPERLDAEHPPASVFTPLSADSSQLAAILACGAGKDFVLFGPPGTGKSQTIANMIAHTLALGRTVLFVSQKTAALDVVRRRLDAAGLGACCLEVHAAKAQKAHVLAQLREAWAARGPEIEPDRIPWAEAGADLDRRRAGLNDLVARLHAPRANGLSAHAALGRVIADRGRDTAHIPLSWPDHTAHTPAILARLRAHIAELATLVPILGDLAEHPLRGIGPAQWSPLWRAEMEQALADLLAVLPPFAEAAHRLGEALALPGASGTWDGTRALVGLANALARPEAAAGLRCAAPDAPLMRHAVEARRRHAQALAQHEARLHGRYAATLFETDLAAFLDAWRAAKGAGILVRGTRLRRLRRILEPDALSPLPDDLGPDLATLVELQRLRAAGPALAGTLERAFAAFGPPWSEATAPAEAFAAPLAWAARMAPALAVLGQGPQGPDALRLHLAGGRFSSGTPFARAREVLAELRPGAIRAIEALNRLADRERTDRPLATGPGWAAGTLGQAASWAASLPKAQGWLRWQGAARAARSAGLGPLVAAVEAGTLPAEGIPEAFEAAYARWWIDHVVTHDSTLRGFQGPDHAGAIEEFRAADARVCALAGAAARARLGALPAPGGVGMDAEWGLLAREIAKRGRHLALRQLFARMPGALTRLTPCVMMSPLSVAQHWPAEARPFDLVIFDEASQIAPWDAIGAIARGRQTVIVGDPEQLPPTSVGERDGEEAGDLDVPDQESILDECLAAHLPQRRLAWHYRSRHESLIAFSNRQYYRGDLITFPSPVTQDRAVRLVPVADGLYERGAARVNRPEARAVVAEVLARLRDPQCGEGPVSLGIVTFNGEQQRLIENLLDAERRADPDLERHFDPRLGPEPVFVKNLETVQGDERDAILFSVAVGPDGAGRITGQVSSLNRAGGHRRLNVAITRARRELLVFASLRPEQIDLGRGAARGIRDLKHFLDFAAHGAPALEAAAAPTGRDVESPFEASVMAALEARGWRVVPQVGVSSFRIDLGIVHPDAPGRYLAGVECDGATYHSAATARDRDRLRQWVLTDLGWRLHRVWSTDWWIDADGALDRLDAALRADLDSDRAQPMAEAPAPVVTPAAPASYMIADLSGFALDVRRLYEPDYDTILDALVAHIVAVEGPIFADILATRVARAHGLRRTTARLAARILGRVDDAVPRCVEDERTVLWPIGADTAAPVRYRPAAGEPRDPGDIPLAELAGLAARLGGDGPNLHARMARHLGLARPSAATRLRLARAVALGQPTPPAGED